MTIAEYTQLKFNIVCVLERSERHKELLSDLKEFFKESINSIRRFERIETITQLLDVLELRDILTDTNVKCLKHIALKLPNSEVLLRKITEYELYHIQREVCYDRGYDSHFSRGSQEKSIINASNLSLTNNMTPRKKERIFRTVIQQIGHFWEELGRNLNIRENDLDKIDKECDTYSEKATEMMYLFEREQADPDRWFDELSDALRKSKCAYLLKPLRKIMVMNI